MLTGISPTKEQYVDGTSGLSAATDAPDAMQPPTRKEKRKLLEMAASVPGSGEPAVTRLPMAPITTGSLPTTVTLAQSQAGSQEEGTEPSDTGAATDCTGIARTVKEIMEQDGKTLREATLIRGEEMADIDLAAYQAQEKIAEKASIRRREQAEAQAIEEAKRNRWFSIYKVSSALGFVFIALGTSAVVGCLLLGGF